MIDTILSIVIVGFVLYACALPFIRLARGKKPSQIEQQLASIPAFAPAVQFTEPLRQKTLALDPTSNRWAVASMKEAVQVRDFGQLVAVEVEKDGVTIDKTNRGSQIAGAAVGGVLLGGLGLLLGGLTGSKRQVAKVQRLALKLYTNDLVTPVTKVIFFDHASGLQSTDDRVIKAATELDEWYGRFRTILQANERGYPATSAPTAQDGQPDTIAHGFGRRRNLVTPG